MQDKRKNPYYQAQAILSHREHSVFEVRQKMKRKGFAASEISQVLRRLEAQGMLNDRAFAELLIRNTLRFKAVGPRWLKAKLAQKRIAPALVDEAIRQTFKPGVEEELARRAAARWLRAHLHSARPNSGEQARPLPSAQTMQPKNRQRLLRFLASRGFSQAAYSFLDRGMSSE
jgi:SOS response regulatory protein OraA/RecX